jgi:hypothetical protein
METHSTATGNAAPRKKPMTSEWFRRFVEYYAGDDSI